MGPQILKKIETHFTHSKTCKKVQFVCLFSVKIFCGSLTPKTLHPKFEPLWVRHRTAILHPPQRENTADQNTGGSDERFKNTSERCFYRDDQTPSQRFTELRAAECSQFVHETSVTAATPLDIDVQLEQHTRSSLSAAESFDGLTALLCNLRAKSSAGVSHL